MDEIEAVKEAERALSLVDRAGFTEDNETVIRIAVLRALINRATRSHD